MKHIIRHLWIAAFLLAFAGCSTTQGKRAKKQKSLTQTQKLRKLSIKKIRDRYSLGSEDDFNDLYDLGKKSRFSRSLE